MDKYEYKHLVEQIQSLIDQGKYAEAAAIADRIDWRRVRSVMMLGTVSDLYKINGRYEDARDVMLLAYDRKPENRQICYSLCELYIKTGEPVEAAEFYKEFEKLAPKDPGRYVLKYKLYDAYDVSLDEKIEVLEKLKAEDYQEKWMYELASLYHRRGLGTKCVEVCDELILWFGSGKYVNMAMELKMLHEPLTPEQQKKYDNRFQEAQPAPHQEPQHGAPAPAPEHVEAPQDHAQNAADLALAEQHTVVFPARAEGVAVRNTHEWDAQAVERENQDKLGDTRVFDPEEVRRQLNEQSAAKDDFDIQVKTVDVGQYNTMNLQAEIAAGLKEILEKQEQEQEKKERPAEDVFGNTRVIPPVVSSDSGPLDMPVLEAVGEDDLEPTQELKEVTESMESSEVLFGATGEMYQDENGYFHDAAEAAPKKKEPEEIKSEEPSKSALEKEAMKAQPPEAMAKVLTQEADGQLRLVMPESKSLEKQITGQLSIEDIRAEWERMKQESQAKQEEEVHQLMLRQTGKMFTEFEEAIRDNILRQMEDEIDPNQFADPEPVPEEPSEKSDNKLEMGSEWDMEGIGELPYKESEEPKEEAKEAEEQKEDKAQEPEETETREPETEETEEKEEESKEEELKAQEAEEKKGEEAAEEEAKEPEAEETEEKEEETEEEDEELEEEDEDTEEEDKELEEEDEDTEEEDEELEEEDEDTEEEDEESEEKEEPEAEKVPETLGEVFRDEFSWGEEAFEEEFEEANKQRNLFANRAVTANAGEGTESGIEFESLPQEEASEEEKEEKGGFAKRFSVNRDNVVIEEDVDETKNFWNDDEDIFDEEDDEEEEQEEKVAAPEDAPAKNQEEEKPATSARELTKEEEALYAPWIRDDSDKEQFARAIDGVSMAAYTGNVFITGDAGLNTVELAKKMIFEIKTSDSNFSGKVAKIPGGALNKKDVGQLLDGLKNGALIVEDATTMSDKTVKELQKNLQRENLGIIVMLLDTKKNAKKFWKEHDELKSIFNVRIQVQPMSSEALADYARQYALDKEYSIDNLGMLALHMKIDEMQSAHHAVNVDDVKEIMDDAIYSASRKTLGHFFDILLGRRYDEEDMIIITEKDFA